MLFRSKILSNLKIDERRAPQDGRFKIQISSRLYALRVSTLTVMDGEKVVMRILDESTKALGLEDLGYWDGAFRGNKPCNCSALWNDSSNRPNWVR